jgi:hypothetical protein
MMKELVQFLALNQRLCRDWTVFCCLTCPIRLLGHAKEIAPTLCELRLSLLKQPITSFRPLVVSPTVNTQTSPVPEVSPHGSWASFTWREGIPLTRLLAGIMSQPSPRYLIRADPFLLHFAENTTTCYDNCPHVTSAPNIRRFVNLNL